MIDVEAAREFTLKRLLLGDMLLNWGLGAVLAFSPASVDRLITYARVVPLAIYRIVGVVFLAFAAWQTAIELRRRLSPAALLFAALMAEAPVVLLTVVLVFMDVPLRAGWRIVLWVGNVYMLFLGAWYIFVARLSIRMPADS